MTRRRSPLPTTGRGERIALRASVQRLAAYLREVHAHEIAAGHYGDAPTKCSYCQAIREAVALIRWGDPR